MRVYVRCDDMLFEITDDARGQRIVAVALALREADTPDGDIETAIFDLIEASDIALLAEDVGVVGNKILLTMPSPDRVRRGARCAEAMDYARRAAAFGLSTEEIAEDLYAAGLADFEGATFIAGL